MLKNKDLLSQALFVNLINKMNAEKDQRFSIYPASDIMYSRAERLFVSLNASDKARCICYKTLR